MPDDIVESVEENTRAEFNQLGSVSFPFQLSRQDLAALEAFAARRGITNEDKVWQALAYFGLEVWSGIAISDAYRDELNKPREDWQTY
jgi:hypothetical protein